MMEQKMKKNIIPLAVAMTLFGCGSDNNDTQDNTVPPPNIDEKILLNGPDNPSWKYVDMDYFELDGTSLAKGQVKVYIGRRMNVVDEWAFACSGELKNNRNDSQSFRYPQDVDGNYKKRLAAQLGKSIDELTDSEMLAYPSTECYSNNKSIHIEGVDYPWMLTSAESDFNSDGQHIPSDAIEFGIKTYEPTINSRFPTAVDVNINDFKHWLETEGDQLGKGASRPDIYQDGYYSAFDLFRYIVASRTDMTFEDITPYQESELDTFEFNVSWDVNGDGQFTATDNQYITAPIDAQNKQLELAHDKQYPAYYNSNRWHYQLVNSVGNDDGDRGNVNNYNYIRMDRVLLRDGQTYRFFPESAVVTERRQYLWKQEVERFKTLGGTPNVPIQEAMPKDENGTPYAVLDRFYYADLNVAPPAFISFANNFKITAHNMRNDIYKKDVITQMDIFLSTNDHLDQDTGVIENNDPDHPRYTFTFWPTFHTGTIVNQFALHTMPFFGVTGGNKLNEGPLWSYGLIEGQSDYGAGVNDCSSFNLEGQPRKINEPYLDDRSCIQNFRNNTNAGFTVNETISTYLIPYGLESFMIYPYPTARDNNSNWSFYLNESYEYNFNQAEQTIANADALTQGTISDDIATLQRLTPATEDHPVGNAPIVKEDHFGWKIADCAQCHNEQKDPKGHGGHSWPVNAADGFDEQQAYYCSTCHGNNGAPDGHGRISSCYWCHYDVDNHGQASSEKLLEKNQHIANLSTTTRAPNKLGNFVEYEDKYVPRNNHYDIDKTWPDPFACGTCHQN